MSEQDRKRITSVMLSLDMLTDIQSLADYRGSSQSDVIRTLLAAGLAKSKQRNDLARHKLPKRFSKRIKGRASN